MNVLKKFSILIILPTLLATCSSRPKSDDRVVLKAGKLTMTMDDLNWRFSSANYNSPDDEYQKKRQFLEMHIDRMLMADAGLEMGLGDSVKIDSNMIQNIITNLLAKKEVVDKLQFSDEDLKKFFDQYGGELKIAHILVNNEPLADSLYELLKKDPGKMAEFAKQFSLDPGSKDNGGVIDNVRFGKMVPEFEETAFALKPGEIAKPVKTTYGWHVIQLIEKQKNTPDDFKSGEAIYRGQYSKYLRQKLENQLKDKIKSKNDFSLVSDVYGILINKLDSLKAVSKTPILQMLSPTDLDPKESGAILASYDKLTCTVGEFFTYIQERGLSDKFNLRDKEQVKGVIADKFYPQMIYKYALSQNIQKSPEYQRQYNDTRNGLVFQKMREKIMTGVAISDSEIHAEYEKNKTTTYMNTAQVRLSEILVTGKDEANSIYNDLKKGVPFAKLLPKTTRTGMIEKGGDLGFIGRERSPYLFEAGIKLNVGAIGGPVGVGDGQFSVFKVTGKLPPQPKSIEEVGPRIKNDLSMRKGQAALQSWAAERKTKVENSLNLDLLKNNLKTGKLKDAS